jgi:hypothetical protein
MSKYKLKAVRVPEFDMVDCPYYGQTPYGVCLDVYDLNDNFLESGSDWSYFKTEEKAEEFCQKFNLKTKSNDK